MSRYNKIASYVKRQKCGRKKNNKYRLTNNFNIVFSRQELDGKKLMTR